MRRKHEPRPESYLRAAVERADDALLMYEAGRFATAIWVSGVAMECLFRAYHLLHSNQINTGHDLKQLYKDSRFSNFVSPARVDAMGMSIALVAAKWRHHFRYDLEKRIRASIGRADFERTARTIVNTMQTVTNLEHIDGH